MSGPIAWFAGNRVAANLLMLLIVVAGLLAAPRVEQEIFPEASLGVITITVVHEGAAPDEVEAGLCIPIEEAVHALRGVRRVRSTAVESLGTVAVELERRADVREVLREIEARVEAIAHFPDEAEAPVIREVRSWGHVIDVALVGDVDEAARKTLAERVRDELLDQPDVARVELTGVRPDEISIEVSEDELRRHGLAFDDVVAAVRRSSIDLPGGSLRTAGGEILLRAAGEAAAGPEFERIVLLPRADGTRLRLGDVARVVDGFAETDQRARFDGRPAALLRVMRAGDQNLVAVSDAVRAYVAELAGRLPPGLEVRTWRDDAQQLRSRRDLMTKSGLQGLALVLIALALFLRARLALWVSAGICVSFLGALALMPVLDLSLNMISSLGFLVALGLVTDDAIVVGERIERRSQSDPDPLRAALRGAREVATPVAVAALTTMLALAPCFVLPGLMGAQSRPLPMIVIACLVFSLIESLLILPAHLAHRGEARARWRALRGAERVQARFARGLERFVVSVYLPLLRRTLRQRALALALGTAVFLVTLGCLLGSWIPFTFLPNTESNHVTAILTLPRGSSVEGTDALAGQIEASALRLRDQLDAEGHTGVIRSVHTSIGEQPEKMSLHFFSPLAWSRFRGAHVAEVQLELAPAETRGLSAADVADRWRALTGPIPDAEELAFASSFFSVGNPVHVQLAGRDADELERAAQALADRLTGFEGVHDVASSHRRGKRELRVAVRPEAEAHGLSLAAVARQVRQGFHGEEAQRIQRGREDVAVVVRYPAGERRSLGDLERMWIRTPARDAVPFAAVARAETARGWASIDRADRRRTVSVTADLDPALTNANRVVEALEEVELPALLAGHPGVSYSLEGQQRDQAEFLAALGTALVLSLLGIYVLLAFPLRSYLQPLLILLAVPFGLIGAVWGHALLGMDLTSFSLVGLIGLQGVVVNDSLVLVHALGALRRRGVPLPEAIERACVARFRPIVVTTATTCLGLTPLLFERSTQAQWIRPIAVSLAFGELFSTAVVLLLVPAAVLASSRLGYLGSAKATTKSPAVVPPRSCPPAAITTNWRPSAR
ncbi:MAG: efflux RND transporter permease subunit [Myxococcota bacterium]|nr:efflux RND transporter permease subunit [Myxococcota bacterium]